MQGEGRRKRVWGERGSAFQKDYCPPRQQPRDAASLVGRVEQKQGGEGKAGKKETSRKGKLHYLGQIPTLETE